MAAILAIFGGYCLVSFLLARKPNLVHTKRRRAFTARHISHRGGAGECLENTMSAFRHASSIGTDMFELDCHLTRDGEVVVSHDNNLERMFGVSGLISDFTYQELPKLHATMEVQFDPGSSCPESDDRFLPRLSDVFAAFPSMPINIDVKVENDELIRKVSDLVRQYNRSPITVWGSRNESVAQKLYAINPDVPLFFSVRASLKLILFYWTGLLPFVPIQQSYLELPMPSIFRHPRFEVFGTDWKGRLIVFIMDLLSMRPGLFKHLDKRGISTYLWVLNTEEEFERAYSLGVEGVMTDYPTRLRAYLDRQSHSNEGASLIKK